MIERLVLRIISTSVTGGLSIIIFVFLSWLLRGRYGAGSRKNGWILIAVCLFLPLDLIRLPHINTRTVQLPGIAIREAQDSAQHPQDTAQQAVQNAAADADMDDMIQTEPYNLEIPAGKILFCIWLAGALLLAAYHVLLYRKMCRRARRQSRACHDGGLDKMAAGIAADLGLKGIPKICLIKSDGPFTMGIIKNMIFLPDGELLEKDLHFILKHELAHCRERDILWKLLFLAAGIMHWFNPLAWLMRVLAENDIEQACDGIVLKNSPEEERREYGEAIMARVEKNRQRRSPAATGYMAEMAFLKQRFANIYDGSPKKNGAVLSGAALIAVLLLGSAIDIRSGEGVGEPVSRTEGILINASADPGIELRTDLNGDGKEDKVRVADVRDGGGAYTQIVANVGGVDVAAKNYDGYYASTAAAGDLSGNGRADVVLVRGVYTSNYGAVEISILHLEGKTWVEYPYNFIHNPNASVEQPVSFEAEESWHNGDLYIEGATIFEENGKTMVRFIQLLPEEDDETVNVIDASYREEGWYIEDIWTVQKFYSGDRFRKILEPGN